MSVLQFLVLEGDGIGPEIIAATLQVLRALPVEIVVTPAEIGLTAHRKHRTTFPDAVLEQAKPKITVAGWQRRAPIGLQVTNGALTNMIISDPGPLYFDNDSIKTELADIVVRCIWPGRN